MEEELRGKDNLLEKKSQQLQEYAVKLAKYKSKSKSTIKTPTLSATTDVGSIDVMSRPDERLDNRVQKRKEDLGRRNAQIVSEKDKISTLEKKYEKRGQAIVKLINKVGQLQNRLAVSEDLIAIYCKRETGKSAKNILRAVAIMENGLNNLFDCFKICCLDLGNLVWELQKRTVDLEYYVAECSSEGFFHKYSLKSIPIKNCITAISKNFLKHQDEMCNFNQNLRKAVAVIQRLYKRAVSSGRALSSSESTSSRVLSSSLHNHLRQSSLSSIDMLAQKRRSSPSLHDKKRPCFKSKPMVKDEREENDLEKSVADIRTPPSGTSVSAVSTSGSEGAMRGKKRYKLKKHFGRNVSGFKERSSKPEKICSVGQVELTWKKRLATTQCSDKNERIPKAETSHRKAGYTKRDRKQATPGAARPPRRRHKVKTSKQSKLSRTNDSRNALLEGLGYKCSTFK